MSKITKGFKQDGSEWVKGLLFKNPHVECVNVIDKILKMFEGQRGSEGSVTKGFKKLVEGMRPHTNDDVILHREAGTLGVREISRRLCIISANLPNPISSLLEAKQTATYCLGFPMSFFHF